jgi:hypothetical protein
MKFTLPFLLTTIAFGLCGGFLSLRIFGEKDIIYFSGATVGAVLGVISYQILFRFFTRK